MTEAEPAGSNQPSPVAALPAPVIGLERAGFGIRLAAALIDGAIILPTYLVLSGAFHYAVAAHALGWSPRRADPVFISIFFGNALVLAYSLLEVKYGTTPGK